MTKTELIGPSLTGLHIEKPSQNILVGWGERSEPQHVGYSLRRLGWRPQVDLHDGLARTVEWYREQLQSGALVIGAF